MALGVHTGLELSQLASARIGAGVVLDGVVIGENSRIAAGNELRAGLRIWPGVDLGPTAIRFSTDT